MCEIEYYVKKLTTLREHILHDILCFSWIHDCGKMVDWQKALLMVLLALLIYPNDIFGKYQIVIIPDAQITHKYKCSQKDSSESVSITRYLLEMVTDGGERGFKGIITEGEKKERLI